MRHRLLPALSPVLLSALVWLAAACARPAHAAPTFEQVRADFRPSETLVLDRHGQLLQRVRTDRSVRRGQWLRLEEVSPALRLALLLSEDKRFYEHSGVDWQAVSAAAWGNLWSSKTRGASTLTMQLAGLLDEDLRQGPGGRSLGQKLGQAVMAKRLEGGWRKDQILEAYLNLVPFRGELVGLDALSRTLFGKAAHGLEDSEAAIAAALVRAPNARPAQVAQRACGVLKTMRPGQDADCVALEMLTELSLSRRAWPATEGIAPHLARRLLARQPAGAMPAEIRSTLDADIQRQALELLQQHVRELQGRNVQDGALIVLDNASGQVLAWVGSTGRSLSRAAEVDAATAARQPGSTLKPFLYAQAIAEQRLTAASLLQDSPEQLQTASGLYIPQNYDRRFKGWVSVRTALASSLNVPAVRTLVMVGVEPFHQQLERLGLKLAKSGGHYGYSLALGSAEVSLLNLTNAYRALANGGRYSPVSLTPDSDAPAFSPALDAGAAFIVSDILSDRNARALTFGPSTILNTRFWSAIKTGTSKDMRDNWAVGYSSRYTVGVWVGNASGAPMWDVSGSSGAAPVWAQLMRRLHQGVRSTPPSPPAGLVQQNVRFGPGLEAARPEWFLPGTAQSLFAIPQEPSPASAASGTQPRINAPVDGSIIALDPDIPPANQRLLLQAQPGSQPPASLRWWIGEREVGRGPQARWLPWPGRHTISLRGPQGQVYEERRIEVRGAAPASANLQNGPRR